MAPPSMLRSNPPENYNDQPDLHFNQQGEEEKDHNIFPLEEKRLKAIYCCMRLVETILSTFQPLSTGLDGSKVAIWTGNEEHKRRPEAFKDAELEAFSNNIFCFKPKKNLKNL
ncbi:hypothetical protein TNCV_489771 [Trichonephila clavipes]|nr:hypothetical protein TNCV_489771 [Trichonephila clavipes]